MKVPSLKGRPHTHPFPRRQAPMSKPLFHIDSPGLLTTVQDQGRPGFASQGVPVGGAMDTWAARVANLLVGNDPGDAVLEMTLTGPALRVLQASTIAVCGADLLPQIDNAFLPMWRTVPVKQGQMLRFKRRKSGARAYLAAAGGFSVPLVLGSRSTELRAGFGGFGGRALRAGDVLDTGTDNAPGVCGGRGLRASDIPQYPGHVRLRIIPGPQDDLFTNEARSLFLSATYTVTPQSDRMGYRLEGPRLFLHPQVAGTLPSAGVTFGCVQVAGGRPLLLMADCQTTGGYPVIGVVIRADLFQAAQCVSGTTVSFHSVSVEDAQEAWRAQQQFLRVLAGAGGG